MLFNNKEYNRILLFFKKISFLQHITMENPRLEEENIIKVVKNLFRLEKRNNSYQNERHKEIFLDQKKKEEIKDSFENEEENDHKPVGVSNFWSSNCIECESNGDRNKTLSVDESFNKVIPYLTKHYK